MFMLLSVDGTLQMMFILVLMGILALLVCARLGVVRQVMLFGFGFSAIINPRKFFGVSGDLELLAWTVTVFFISFFDIAAATVLVTYARKTLQYVHRLLPGPVKFALAGFVILMLASLRNVTHWEEAWAHVFFEFKCIAIFAIVFGLIVSRGTEGAQSVLRPLLVGLSAGMVVEAGVVMLEYVGVLRTGQAFLGIRVGSLREDLGRAVEALRVGGTYQHPNYLAVAAGAMFLVLWQVEMDSYRRAARSLSYWLGIGASFVCLILPLSRGGWLGTFCGAALYVATMLWTRGADWIRSLPWKYLFPAILAVGVVGVYFSGAIYDKLFYSSPLNVDARGDLNDMAMEVIREHPWLGAGIAQHGFAMKNTEQYGKYHFIAGLIPVVHNIYLLIVSELGIIGGVLYILIPFLAIYYGLRACRRGSEHSLTGLLCGLCSSLVVFLVADLFGPSLRKVDIVYLYWLLMAMTFAAAALVEQDVRNGRREPLRPGGRRKKTSIMDVYVDVG